MDDTITHGLLILILNLIVFGFNLKLYTEYFKDKKIERRKQNEIH